MNVTGRLGELLEDWRTVLRQDGARVGLPRIAQEVAQLPYRHLRFVLLARSLRDPLPDLPARIALTIQPFTESHLPAARAIDRPSEARLCARRLAAGHTGLVALHQGAVIGYAWGCAEINPSIERVPLDLQPGDVLCSDVFTQPAFRGQGVQTALSLARFDYFRQAGFLRALCTIETRNAPSLAVWQRKLGAQCVATIDFLRIGRWYRIRFQEAKEGEGK